MKQDGSREWISVCAAVLGNGEALSPAIIMSGDSGYVQDTWIQDYDYLNGQFRALFAATESGWINTDLMLDWLQKVIDKETRLPNGGGGYRLLLMDRHTCYI
jgi:hypothetical protein